MRAHHISKVQFFLIIDLMDEDYSVYGCDQFSSVQLLSCVRLFVTSWTAAHQAFLSSIISQSLLKLTSIESVMPSNHLILCHPFFSCSQSFPASGSFPMCQLFTSGGQILVLQLQHWSIHLSFPFKLKVTFLGKTSLTSSPTLL